MQNRFKDLLDIKDVHGVLFAGFDGAIEFMHFNVSAPSASDRLTWSTWVKTFGVIREADFVYENRRIYVRRTESGFIIVVMGGFASISLVRLNCDILLPTFDQSKKKAKGLGRFFR